MLRTHHEGRAGLRWSLVAFGATVAMLVCTSLAAAAGDGTVPSFRIDASHSGVQVDPALQLPLVRRWAVEFGDAVS